LSSTSNFDQAIIEEFRANKGAVGGGFAGAPMVLLHTTGAKSGAARVHPLVSLTGEERDRLYAEQATHMPAFADYEAKTKGIRTIPVVALTRRR
jgi:hypothetical protein